MAVTTKDELRFALGLKPHDEWEYDVLLQLGRWQHVLPYTQAVQSRFRGTGRTMEIILDALVYVAEGNPVVLVAPNNSLTDYLSRIARILCIKLGFDPTLISTTTVAREQAEMGRVRAPHFYDHTCYSPY